MEYVKVSRDQLHALDDIIRRYHDETGNLTNADATLLIRVMQECEIAEHEVDLGNYNITNDILTVINKNGDFEKYQLLHKKANKGDLVLITNGGQYTPFKPSHNGRFFIVSRDTQEDKWIHEHCVVGNWCLYNHQYIVLEKI